MQDNILSTDTTRSFWKKQKYYPSYGDVIKKRRLYETAFLADWVWGNKPKTLVDIGCGNGSTVTMLNELTNISDFHCYDISPGMLEKLDSRNIRGANITTYCLDLCGNYKEPFHSSDLTTVLGVNMYLTDEQILKQFSKIRSSVVITRDPCSPVREEINKYSEDLGSDYSAVYRTTKEYAALYEEAGFKVIYNKRAFPDEIESKFGTRQQFYICEKK